jgi:hypothetical protein
MVPPTPNQLIFDTTDNPGIVLFEHKIGQNSDTVVKPFLSIVVHSNC